MDMSGVFRFHGGGPRLRTAWAHWGDRADEDVRVLRRHLEHPDGQTYRVRLRFQPRAATDVVLPVLPGAGRPPLPDRVCSLAGGADQAVRSHPGHCRQRGGAAMEAPPRRPGVHLPPRFVAREPPGRRRGGRGAGPRRRRAPLRHPELPDADRDARAALRGGEATGSTPTDAVFRSHGFNSGLVAALCANGASVVVDVLFLPLLLALGLGAWRLPPVAAELRRGVGWRARRRILLQFARLALDLLLAVPLALVVVSWRPAPPRVAQAARELCGSGSAGGGSTEGAADLEAASEGTGCLGRSLPARAQTSGEAVREEGGEDCSPVTECHAEILRSFGLVVLDLLVAPLVVALALLAFYRVPALAGGFRGRGFLLKGLRFHREVFVQLIGFAMDLPFLLVGLVLLLSGWRADLALRACGRRSGMTYGERRRLVGKQFLFLLRDVAMLGPFALVVITLYRLPSLVLALKARMSRLLAEEPEMQPVEVRLTVPDPKGNPTCVVRASKSPNLSGVASMRLQITGDDFWKAIAQQKGATMAAAARAMLPLALRHGKEVDLGSVQRGRDEAELSIELQQSVKRKTALKVLQGLPRGVELLVQLEARLDSGRDAVLLAVPLTAGQLADCVASAGGRVQQVAQPGLGEGRLQELRGSAAGMLRRDVWWAPVLAEGLQVLTDLAHLALLVGLLACPWRLALALAQLSETRGRRMGRRAGAVLVALDFWEAECRRLMLRVVPLANGYAKAAVRAGSGPAAGTPRGGARRAESRAARDDDDDDFEQGLETCIGVCCCVVCPCCPNYADFDSDSDVFSVPARSSRGRGHGGGSAADALDRRLKRLGRPLVAARTLLRQTRKRWPEEPEWGFLSDAVDARLEAWSQAFFWTLLLPEVHLLLAGHKITRDEHSRLCQAIRRRAEPQARELRCALQLQQQIACEQFRSRRKAQSTCYSIIREHTFKSITDILALPAVLLLGMTIYRLPNLSAGLARPFDMRRFKTAVKLQAVGLGSDILVLMQFLVLAALLAGTVVKLPDFLWGLQPARGLRKARGWALAKVSELVVGLAELITLLFAWKAYRLLVTAVVFVTLTPAAMLALTLPRNLPSRVRFGLASAVWLGAAALGFVVGDLAGLAAAAALLATASAGLAANEALHGPEGWAVRRDGDWWSPQARWTAPNLFALMGIVADGAVMCWAGAALASLAPGPAELTGAGVGPAAAGVGVVIAALLHITLPMVVEEEERADVVEDAAWRAARQLLQEVLFLPTVAVLAPMTPRHPAWTLPLLYFAVVAALSPAAWGTPLSRAGLLDIRTLGLASSGRQLLLAAAVVVAARGWRLPFASLAAAAALWTLAWTPRGAAVRWAELLRAGAALAAAGAALEGLPRGPLVAAAACWAGLTAAFAAASGWQLAATAVPQAVETLGLLQARLSLWGGDGPQHRVALGASVPGAAAALLDLEERTPFDRLRLGFLRARDGWRAQLRRAADYGDVLAQLKELEGALTEPPTRILIQQVLERMPLARGRRLPAPLAAEIAALAVPRPGARPPEPPRGWEHGRLDLVAARQAAASEAAKLPAQLQTRAGERPRRSTRSGAIVSERREVLLAPSPAVMGASTVASPSDGAEEGGLPAGRLTALP
ncbi:unnamed protein product [Prorocentrum cordatum]|uniref:Uncharacterized protein n=1 Tax=Prorocentrum cordatum TaxID=2364126 RepID=A0ABN9VI06_9DINO|nr:unnamed protein product [Polarella glacialis]